MTEPHILLVEDDQCKSQNIQELLSQSVPKARVSIAKSVVASLEKIDNGKIDLLILDLAIPDYDEGSEGAQDLGGVTVFRYLQQAYPEVPVIVITQYEALLVGTKMRDISKITSDLHDEFGEQFVGLLQYKLNEDMWKNALVEHLEIRLKR